MQERSLRGMLGSALHTMQAGIVDPGFLVINGALCNPGQEINYQFPCRGKRFKPSLGWRLPILLGIHLVYAIFFQFSYGIDGLRVNLLNNTIQFYLNIRKYAEGAGCITEHSIHPHHSHYYFCTLILFGKVNNL
jgi:hypothetical protein